MVTQLTWPLTGMCCPLRLIVRLRHEPAALLTPMQLQQRRLGWTLYLLKLVLCRAAIAACRKIPTGLIEPSAASAQSMHVVFENVIATTQLARPFTEIDRSDLSEFLERWLGWLAMLPRATFSVR